MSEMGPNTVRRLETWQEAMTLTQRVCALSVQWPKAEVYGLTSQARRAAVSIPANIAEGVGRGSRAEAARFGRIALAGAYKLHTLLEFSARLSFSPLSKAQEVMALLDPLTRRSSSFIHYQETQRP